MGTCFTLLFGLPAPFERVALEGHTDNVTACEWNPDVRRCMITR
jgi:hypothetical protein